jgi:pantoate--beta-alanine ligase
MKMNMIESPNELQQVSESLRLQGKKIALVPTMGALHDGHLSLVELAKARADVIVMSIFVNPLQFGKNEDFGKYPRPFERDKSLADSAGVDILFAPARDALYNQGFQSFVEIKEISQSFEGKIRPDHFRGVATIVNKLFNLAKPHIAVFGQKDAQQLALVRRMVLDLNIDVEILAAPIVRESDGLAMSSRNVYLNQQERQEAVLISEAIKNVEAAFAQGERNVEALLGIANRRLRASNLAKPEYVSVVSAIDFSEAKELKSGGEYFLIIAARFGEVRLLDNLHIQA